MHPSLAFSQSYQCLENDDEESIYIIRINDIFFNTCFVSQQPVYLHVPPDMLRNGATIAINIRPATNRHILSKKNGTTMSIVRNTKIKVVILIDMLQKIIAARNIRGIFTINMENMNKELITLKSMEKAILKIDKGRLADFPCKKQLSILINL